ncbi:glycosyltransferase family 8 protein [Propionispora hippei]|uniref:UDP-glucose:(Galactosyl)LPS alpha-1,2-glucosyltransferase n=1 Tax=Propionispora hippei DSM 15287 TaxID=1123003 RepID=A0A1M6K496_9FIRM|nr:glycosyltransferase [Propionispora hippei]SHJ53712.1 UDP-glucose:(galactosyl)LPS alpha-1,2-glucosyltransferase [Propionispora hippei DSM 15287]
MGRQHVAPGLEEIHIGYGIDNNYVRCMGASIASICHNNQDSHIIVHVLASGLTNDSTKKLEQLACDFNVNIHVYTIDQTVFAQLPVQVHFPASIYYRFILPAILEVPKVLYLDADIICLRNIQALFAMDLADHIAAAVPDVEPLATKRNTVLGLANHTYFNSGVLLLVRNHWNNYQVANKALTLLAQEPQKFRYPDQDVLNVVLSGKITYLGQEWNRINTPYIADDGIRFLHFAAHPKPWSIAWALSDLCNDFTRNIYSMYEGLSPWKNCPPTRPQNYREMRNYARCLLKTGDYLAGLYWYGKYIKTKVTIKFAGK